MPSPEEELAAAEEFRKKLAYLVGRRQAVADYIARDPGAIDFSSETKPNVPAWQRKREDSMARDREAEAGYADRVAPILAENERRRADPSTATRRLPLPEAPHWSDKLEDPNYVARARDPVSTAKAEKDASDAEEMRLRIRDFGEGGAAEPSVVEGHGERVAVAPKPSGAVGGGVIPAHEVPLVAPRHIAALEAGQKKEEQGLEAGAVAQMNATQAEARGLGEKRDLYAEAAAATEARAKAQDEFISRKERDLEAMSREVGSMKVDPERFMKDIDPGKHAMLLLGAMFSGFAQGWNKTGSNPALESLQADIDRNIAAQKVAIENGHHRVAEAKGLLAETYKRFGNMDQAVAAARAMMVQSVDTKIQQIAASSKVPSIKAAATTAEGQLEKLHAAELAKWHQWVQEQAVGGGGGAAGSGSIYDEIPDDRVVPYRDPATGKQVLIEVQNKADQEHVYSAVRKAENVSIIADKIIDQTKKGVWENLGSNGRAIQDLLAKQIAAAEADESGRGGGGLGKLKEFAKVVNMPFHSLRPGAVAAVAKGLKEMAQEQADSAVNASAIGTLRRPSHGEVTEKDKKSGVMLNKAGVYERTGPYAAGRASPSAIPTMPARLKE